MSNPNVVGNREALSVNCVIELLKYSQRKVMVEEHPNAMERIKDVEEYRFVLN